MDASHITTGELARQYLLDQAKRMDKLGAPAAAGDVEAIHDLRVAIRRARSILRLLGKQLGLAVARSASRQLRAAARALGAVRDGDVFLEILESLATPSNDARLTKLRAEAISRRAQSLSDLATFLQAPEWRDAKIALRKVADRGAKHGSDLVGDELPALVWAQFSKLRSRARMLSGAGVEEIHRARIEAKRLRYALEFLSRLDSRRIKPLLDPIVAFQDAAGALHDAVLAGARVANERELMDALEDRVAHLRAQALSDAERDLDDRYRRRLALALARL